VDHLWSPWRYKYLTEPRAPAPAKEFCIFCQVAAEPDKDDANLIVIRGEHNFIVLNRYPYTSGHLMVVPYAHQNQLTAIGADAATEMILMARDSERHLRAIYNPDGMNLGMNIGESAGAGIAGHIHMHVLPRWAGDTNFMTTVAETRVLPEDLPVTLNRLRAVFCGTETISE
jgi:ATP adenylyltransferase